MPGGISLNRFDLEGRRDGEILKLPCGSCLGCQMGRSRDWAVRCALELQGHDAACWSTLTYDDANVPATLSKPHLSGAVKRLRAVVSPHRFKFFGAGEYGERTFRPHYHAIWFGLSLADHERIQAAWPFGFVRSDPISPAAVAYVAGYCAKKLGWQLEKGERLDPSTGELYQYQPPFIQMSRGGRSGVGIGGDARKHYRSWRSVAIYQDKPVPVPRYLHNAFLDQASESELESFTLEREELISTFTSERRDAAAAIAVAALSLKAEKRTL